MSEIPPFKTRVGQTFYERTMPALVEQLKRLNDLLERLVSLQRADRQNILLNTSRSTRWQPYSAKQT